MMNVFVPLSVMFSDDAPQLGAFTLEACCKVNPLEGDGQETTTVFVCVRRIVNAGAPGVSTALMIPQKPPANE